MNFLEVESLEDANEINLNRYAFVKFSETRNCYIFKIRERKRSDPI